MQRVKLEFVGHGCDLGRADVMGAHTTCRAKIGGKAVEPQHAAPCKTSILEKHSQTRLMQKSLKVLIQGTLETVQQMCSWV